VPSTPAPPPRRPLDPLQRGIPLVRLPADDAVRVRLAQSGLPRLLVVTPTAAPPSLLDDLEDWVREPVSAAEVDARCDVLARRHRSHRRGVDLPGDGNLYAGDVAVMTTPLQEIVLTPLVANAGRPVKRSTVFDAYVSAGGRGSQASFMRFIARLATHLRPAGLALHVLSHGGSLMLERSLSGPHDRATI